jgi:polyhydroxyalkanoate synthesis regulator phasin
VVTMPTPPSYVVKTPAGAPGVAAMDPFPSQEPAREHEAGNGAPLGTPVADPAPSPAFTQLQAAFRERFDTLLPTIQREWPEVARHTLEATRGSFDQVADAISRQTGITANGARRQLLDLLQATTQQAGQVAESLTPLEEQLEQILDDLNTTLRPRIEKPVRERPLMALGIAAGIGLLAGLLLSSGRRSA